MINRLLETERTAVYIQNQNLTGLIYKYYEVNKSHLAPWEPIRNHDYFSKKAIRKRLKYGYQNYKNGHALQLAALDKEENQIIGLCNFTNFVHGPFQACFLGYSVAQDYEGKGYMTEILRPSIELIFNRFGLHRVMANYIPRNQRSGKLLEKLNFEKEGLARSYLKINGKWEDHILTSRINGA